MRLALYGDDLTTSSIGSGRRRPPVTLARDRETGGAMRVLYVDDEPTIRRAVELWLSRYGIHVVTAASLAEARDQFERHRIDGVFLDIWLEDGSGFELYDWLLTAFPALADRVAFVTGDMVGSPRSHNRLSRLNCSVLRKPFDLDALRDVVAQWVRGAGRDRANQRAAELSVASEWTACAAIRDDPLSGVDARSRRSRTPAQASSSGTRSTRIREQPTSSN